MSSIASSSTCSRKSSSMTQKRESQPTKLCSMIGSRNTTKMTAPKLRRSKLRGNVPLVSRLSEVSSTIHKSVASSAGDTVQTRRKFWIKNISSTCILEEGVFWKDVAMTKLVALVIQGRRMEFSLTNHRVITVLLNKGHDNTRKGRLHPLGKVRRFYLLFSLSSVFTNQRPLACCSPTWACSFFLLLFFFLPFFPLVARGLFHKTQRA